MKKSDEQLQKEVAEIRRFIDGDSTDKIVKQIEQLRMQYFLTIANAGDKALDVAYEKVYQALDEAIEIVKAGGKHDK